jgi:hypothetical protein
MRNQFWNRARLALAGGATGTLFQFGGCDPTVRAALEDGIISLANSLLAAVLQAILQLFQEGQRDNATALAAQLLQTVA